MFGRFPLLFAAAALHFFGACASSPPGDLDVRPKELPANLQAKFEVSERVGERIPGPVVVPPPNRKTKAVVKAAAFAFPVRRPAVDAIWVGEKQILEITYLGLKAGEFTLDVLPFKEVAGRKVFHLRATAISSSIMNLFYRLHDSIESFWDYDGRFSFRFHLVLDETKQKRDALELYDSEAKSVFYWNRRNHVDKGNTETKETFEMAPFPQDSLSGLYSIRTLPLEDGKTYSIPISSEGKGWEAVITVVRRETVDTPLGRKLAVVVRLQTRYQGVLQQSEQAQSLIWLTDDDRRFIARLEAQVKVGSIAAKLARVELGENPNVQ
jgi:hypothetical protein